MSLNIKNEETHRLARELAGETMTGAVTVVLRERLEREQRERSVGERLRRMRPISKSIAKSLRPGPSAVAHGDFLYDEPGLPA